MAEGGGTPGNGGDRASVWRRDRCVVIDVGDNTKVKASEIIRAVCESVGVDSILGCVPKAGNIFELNLKDEEAIQVLSPALSVGENRYEVREIVKNETVVSFIHLPTYISDEQITEKLEALGVTLVGDIKRRKYPGTNVVDGTRHVKVRFPPNLKSLPYSMRFHDGENFAYYRVIHNGQMKVCNRCLGDDHVFKNCPENMCYKCGDFGHLSRFCEAPRCDNCRKYGSKCECAAEQDDEDYCDGCHRGSHRCVCNRECDGCRRPYLDCHCDMSTDHDGEGGDATTQDNDSERDQDPDQSAPVKPVQVPAEAKPVQGESTTAGEAGSVQPAVTGTPVQHVGTEDIVHTSPMETTDETIKRKHDDVSDDNVETGECSLSLVDNDNNLEADDESSQFINVVKKKKSGKKHRRQRLVTGPTKEAVLKCSQPKN